MMGGNPLFASLFRRAVGATGSKRVAERLYKAVVDQARNPVFYLEFGVPDTETGRFEMICLHIFPVLRRLKDLGSDGVDLSQSTHDVMFADIDRTLREMGIGDMGVGKRVKKLATSLYGRIGAYEAGLSAKSSGSDTDSDTGDALLIDALRRNLYGTLFEQDGVTPTDGKAPSVEQIAAIADYLRQTTRHLDAMDAGVLMEGELLFPVPQKRRAPA